MFEVPRRRQRLAVALPASLTLDVPHLREKTARIGSIARSLAIFRVEEAIIYHDTDSPKTQAEGKLLEKILRFQETPQYLRQHLFGRDADLQFAGVLPPLRTPHHPDRQEPQVGQLREAVAVTPGARWKVEAGFKEPVEVNSKLEKGRRVTIRITQVSKILEAEVVERSELHIYWGFTITRQNRKLGEVIKRGGQDLAISTSRKGDDVRKIMDRLQDRWKTSSRPILLFGSPQEGVPEILARNHSSLSSVDFNLNTIPDQGVQTVRTEEALQSTLALINLLEET